MNDRPCTDQFLAYTFIGAMCQLLSKASPLSFGPGTTPPTVLFSLSELGVQGSCHGRVRLEALDDEFAVFSLDAPTTYETFTPALRRALGADEEDRSVVEFTTVANLGYRISRIK